MTFIEKLKEYITIDLPKYLGQTLEMVFITTLIALFFGLLLGLVLYFTKNSKNKYVKCGYKVLDIFVNIVRSFPFYVLMFFVVPFTRIIMDLFTGKAIAFSTEAFIVPLTLAAIPFFGKLIENSLNEIDKGVIEAGIALGLNKWQITTKIILKEALPSIINGITLAIITLIGYSAMAGAVGGGGLGFFAYDKGYVGYDFIMMLFAVITIIILVLLIQALGNLFYKLAKNGKVNFMKAGVFLTILILIFVSVKVVTVLGNNNYQTITIGTMRQPGEPIINSIRDDLKRKGYEVNIKIFTEYQTPNQALADGSIDANLFQHEPFLKKYNEANGTNLIKAVTLFDALFGAYSLKIDNKNELIGINNAVIAVAQDASNLDRCLKLLEAEGIIILTDEYKQTTNLVSSDIKKYYKSKAPYNVELRAVAENAIANALKDDDVYIGLISDNFAIPAGLGKDEMLFNEVIDDKHTNANIVAIRESDKNQEWALTLAEVITSKQTEEFILSEFKGVIQPYFINHLLELAR